MDSIHTKEGLLFRSYISGYNLSLLHTHIREKNDSYENEAFFKASLSLTELDFQRKINDARKKTEAALSLMQNSGINIIAHFDRDYPAQLKRIKDFPPLLFMKGDLPDIPLAAVVGSRNNSPMAAIKTDWMVSSFLEHQYGIISGLALGIDTMAHQAALKYKGYTAAILATSLNKIYPEENQELAKRILDQGGALIAEQAPFMVSVANPFVLRNRIQAALSDYTIPVEMSLNSGTQYTVQYAARYGKKIMFFLPGPAEIDNYLPYYEGIIAAVKKYKANGNSNMVIIKNKEGIVKLLQSGTDRHQTELF